MVRRLNTQSTASPQRIDHRLTEQLLQSIQQDPDDSPAQAEGQVVAYRLPPKLLPGWTMGLASGHDKIPFVTHYTTPVKDTALLTNTNQRQDRLRGA